MLSQIPRNVGRDVANVLFFPLQAVAAEFDELESLLSREEIARADRYALDKLRRRYIIGRARLRQLLGKLTETPPAAVRISYERRGKPKLDSNEVPLVHFNVAHSADWAAIAWATSEIGIDLEIAQPGFQHASIASQVLSQTEQIQWDRIPADKLDREMMRLWVCKEALLKAMGLGIGEGLREVSFELPIPTQKRFNPLAIGASLQLNIEDDGTCARNHWTDCRSWSMHYLDAIPTAFIALATSARVQQVLTYSLDPSGNSQ